MRKRVSPEQRPSTSRAIARPVGIVVLGLAAAMGVCALVGLGYFLAGAARPGVDDHATLSMAVSALVTALLGGILWRAGASIPAEALRRREAALAVTIIWFAASLAGALPFVFGAGIAPVDAVFEATSGFTTTGATIVTDIEGTLSRPVLLWRSLTQWLGGMGIVVLFVAVFPSLGVGGKHLYAREVPGHTSEGLQPRITDTAIVLWRIYATLTAADALLLWLCGMDPFEAVCHALTTMATGGFSTRDASIAAFDSAAIEVVTATFILVAGASFGLYYALIRTRSLRAVLRSTELRAYAGIVALSVLVVAVGILPNHGNDPLEALRYAYFFVSSTITTTGYVTDDYMAYASPLLALMLFLMLVGGSSGSTAGGMKVSRVVLLAKTAWKETRRSFRPEVVHVVRIEGRPVRDSLLLEVAGFFFVYLAVIGVGIFLVSLLDGVSVATSLGAMVTTVGNNGPGPWYVAADHFAAYSSVSKGWFVLVMVMGRLELLTVLAVLHPDMWR